MICQICGQETTNRKRKQDGNVVLCDFCRASAQAAQDAQAEWEAQMGNPHFTAAEREQE